MDEQQCYTSLEPMLGSCNGVIDRGPVMVDIGHERIEYTHICICIQATVCVHIHITQ